MEVRKVMSELNLAPSGAKFNGTSVWSKHSSTGVCKCPFCGVEVGIGQSRFECPHFLWVDTVLKQGMRMVRRYNQFNFIAHPLKELVRVIKIKKVKKQI